MENLSEEKSEEFDWCDWVSLDIRNETDIIKACVHLKRNLKKGENIDFLQDYFFEGVQGLLDLYNKEKEKNKELEHQQQVEIEGRNILASLNDNLIEELNREKEKSKILELTKIPYLEGEIMAYKENNAVQRKMLNDAFDRGWIHKSKIKEIIYPTPTNPISYEIQTSDMYKKILELLEEE